jgi:DNA-binding MarR family transcriptional regulator
MIIEEASMPDSQECARLLLETIPSLMRGIGGAMRHGRAGDDEPANMGQARMLHMLSCAPRTLSELATRHHVTPSTMSRAIDVLVRKAWVARESDPNDRRQIILTLTEEGQHVNATMQRQTLEVVANMIDQLDDDQRARLYDGLAILRTLLEETTEDRP